MTNTPPPDPKILMTVTGVVFPFDLFGSGGTASGAHLMGDALREMIADAEAETVPARADAYRSRVRVRECEFPTLADFADWQARARKELRAGLRNRGRVLWLAGNHLSVLPAYEELGEDGLVLQFDAHLDVYNLSDCEEELSHGNFLLHAQRPLPKVVNVGSRDLFLARAHVAKHFTAIVPAEDVEADGAAAIERLREVSATARRVWIDIDCDVFDPACFPGVPHPVPMGLRPAAAVRMLNAVWSDRVVGVSISEFDPGRDRSDLSLATLVWLLEWVLLRWTE